MVKVLDMGIFFSGMPICCSRSSLNFAMISFPMKKCVCMLGNDYVSLIEALVEVLKLDFSLQWPRSGARWDPGLTNFKSGNISSPGDRFIWVLTSSPSASYRGPIALLNGGIQRSVAITNSKYQQLL